MMRYAASIVLAGDLKSAALASLLSARKIVVKATQLQQVACTGTVPIRHVVWHVPFLVFTTVFQW